MNKQQLGSLILESQESLYRVAKSLLNNDADCGDAICETIARAFEKLHTIWEVTDEAGNLLPNTRSYLKEGDGVDTIHEVIDTRILPQKMVVVTMEYKNTTEDDLKDILFFNSVTAIDEVDGNYVMARETPSAGDEWDFYQDSADLAQLGGEMIYYTVRGGEDQNGSNYISSLKAGETITMEIGFLVNEEDLEHLYLSADPYTTAYEFNEYVCKSGFVNISN